MFYLTVILSAVIATLLFHFWSRVITRQIEKRRAIDILDDWRAYTFATLGAAALTALSGFPVFTLIGLLFAGR